MSDLAFWKRITRKSDDFWEGIYNLLYDIKYLKTLDGPAEYRFENGYVLKGDEKGIWLIDPKNNILVQQKAKENKDFPYFTKVLGVYLREAP